MHNRTLGKSGFQVSEVGLGCWQLGADWGQDISHNQAFSILEEAVGQGVNFFDTADVYGLGKSERFIGAFLKETKSPVRVATKFGRHSSVFPDQYTEEALRKSVEGSIERLGVDALDLLQLHCIPTQELKNGEIFHWLRKLKEEGLIREFGASVETVEEGLLCLQEEGLCSLQVIFNVFRQKLTEELLPQAKKSNVGIIVRLPLASGLLAGKFTQDTRFANNDHRNFNQNGEVFNVGETFAGLPFEEGIRLVENIRQAFLPEGMNMVQFTLRWILDHEAVSTIIPGASSKGQVISNASVSDLPPLTTEIHKQLAAFYWDKVHDQVRGVY
ncbi:MAG: aldo/keto reductase [Cyclobacteriaceae bacterium]